MELKGGRTMGTLKVPKTGWGTTEKEEEAKEGEEEYKNKRKNLLCTYSTSTYSTSNLPCFPIRCAQHMENVAMDTNNQPGNVLFNPVWQKGDGHNWLAVELEMKSYHISNTKHHSLDCCRYKQTKCYCNNFRIQALCYQPILSLQSHTGHHS